MSQSKSELIKLLFPSKWSLGVSRAKQKNNLFAIKFTMGNVINVLKCHDVNHMHGIMIMVISIN